MILPVVGGLVGVSGEPTKLGGPIKCYAYGYKKLMLLYVTRYNDEVTYSLSITIIKLYLNTLVLLIIARTNFSEFSDDWHNC